MFSMRTEENHEYDRQCTYKSNIGARSVTIFAVEKQ